VKRRALFAFIIKAISSEIYNIQKNNWKATGLLDILL